MALVDAGTNVRWLVAICCLLFFVGAVAGERRVVLERLEGKTLPNGWERLGRPEVGQMLPRRTTLTLALKQRNVDQLERSLRAVSYPSSPQFRQFLSFEEVTAMVAPSEESVATVREWLNKAGVPSSSMELSRSGDFLTVKNVPISIASELLECPFEHFRSTITDQVVAACLAPYSVPADIASLLDFVGGVSAFPKPKPWQLPAKPRTVASNAPLLSKASPGESNFNVFFAPLCDNGAPVTDDHLSCSSGPIREFEIAVTQYDFTQVLYLQPPQLECQPCSSWPAALQSQCTSTAESYGLSTDSVFCLTPSMSSFNLRPYVTFEFALTTHYANGTTSALAVYPKPIVLAKFVSPTTLLDYYGIPESETETKTPFNSQSVAEFLYEYYSPSDLVKFYAMNGIYDKIMVELVGPNNITDPGTEASLDIQFMMGIARNCTTVFWSLGALHNGQEPFLEWIIQVLQDPEAPNVHSISYADDENSLTVQYMTRVNNEFMKAGNMGLTLLFASGDNGVNSAEPNAPSCTDLGQFTPSFPSSSPYVTAVGGTQFSTQLTTSCSLDTQYGLPITCDKVGEISASITTGARITSGGGFSNVFLMPDFQQPIVSAYIDLIGDAIPAQYYNATGRAYPDISACARNFLVVVDGTIHPTDGTSAATPTAAAMMTIINNQLSMQGTSLGWINPALYSAPETVFLDIRMGNNACGEDIDDCCPYGFHATHGYDTVTGMGSINFPNFRDYMTSLSGQ